MGTKNRQRRADKGRERARAEARRRAATTGRPRTPGASSTRTLPRELVREHLLIAAEGAYSGATTLLHGALEVLATQDPAHVEREAEGELLRRVGAAWANGWQPAEIVRQARRRDAAAARLLEVAVAADHVHRASDTLHPLWARQLADLDLAPVACTTGWLRPRCDAEGLDARARTRLAIEALCAVCFLGPIQQLIPPPGAGARDAVAAACGAPDDPMLGRVRALLAQAESTTFEAEAELFTAKAQELMARHAIDAAIVWGTTERGERPGAIRLPIDDPYADAKAALLNAVARASRCSCVLHETYGLCTVVGFTPDLAATELLFTSLLVQSAAALHVEGATAPPGARVRSRGFRSSFLMAYAARVGERLRAIHDRVEADAIDDVGTSLLPVLADRQSAVDDAVREMFSELRQRHRRTSTDRLGWARGHEAAERAELNLDRIGPATTRPRGALDPPT